MKILTEKETKFIEEYLSNGFKGREAYLVAYNTDNKNMASVESYKMLRNEKILAELDKQEGVFRQVAREVNLDKKQIIKKLRDIIFEKQLVLNKAGDLKEIDADAKSANAAIITLARLCGWFEPEKREVKLDSSSIDTKGLSSEELESLKLQLLKEL